MGSQLTVYESLFFLLAFVLLIASFVIGYINPMNFDLTARVGVTGLLFGLSVGSFIRTMINIKQRFNNKYGVYRH